MWRMSAGQRMQEAMLAMRGKKRERAEFLYFHEINQKGTQFCTNFQVLPVKKHLNIT